MMDSRDYLELAGGRSLPNGQPAYSQPTLLKDDYRARRKVFFDGGQVREKQR